MPDVAAPPAVLSTERAKRAMEKIADAQQALRMAEGVRPKAAEYFKQLANELLEQAKRSLAGE